MLEQSKFLLKDEDPCEYQLKTHLKYQGALS